MARKRKTVKTRVTAHLPNVVDLTRLKSGNTLDIEVRVGEDLIGTLLMGRGSVQWWPGGNKTNSLRRSWRNFAELLGSHM